jgi:PAS domain S-box-containing protein
MSYSTSNKNSNSCLPEGEIARIAPDISPDRPQICDCETKYDRFLDAIPQVIWKANADGCATYFSRCWEEYTGRATASALGFGYLECVHPEDRDLLLARANQVVTQKQKSCEMQFRLQSRSGTYRWVLARAAPANAEGEGIFEWVGTAADIDEIKQTQVQMETERDALKKLLRSAGDRSDANSSRDCQYLQAVERFAQLFDRPADNLSELLQAIADAAVAAIAGAQFCVVALPDRDRTHLKFCAVSGAENFATGQVLHVQDRLLSRAFATGEFQLLRCESEGETGCPVPAAACAMPIESLQTGRLGVLAVGSWDDGKAFDGSAHRLLAVVAKQAAIAIDRMRAIECLQQQERVLDLQNQLLVRQREEIENQCRQIQQQNLQLLEAAQLKSQFLNTMSHELRTPMNAIIGFSQLLLRQQKQLLTSQQKDMVARIFNNGKNLLVLINDILDLAKIETGNTQLEIEKFDLANLIISVALEFGDRVTEKNLAMSVSACLHDRYIVNDKSRLRQVLVNLISNAVKFTHRGSIYIQVREVNCDRLLIIVGDTGIGICETELPQIFDKFHQADRTTTRQYPGTGLGLAITASLVKMMNGTICARSQKEKGSQFAIELPRKT